MVKIRDFKENYFFFIFILLSFVLILFFINLNHILPDSDNNSIQNNLSGNDSPDVKSKAPLTTNNSVEKRGDSSTDKDKRDDMASIADLGENEMYYCFKIDELGDKIYEVYFSKDYFHEVHYFDIFDERAFYNGKLYQRVDSDNCNWKIYNQSINQYLNSFFSFINNSGYDCSKTDLDNKLFEVNDKVICNSKNNYDLIGGDLNEI